MAQNSSRPFIVQIQADNRAANAPAWVPPRGYFADVPMRNNPVDVAPSIYGPSATNTAFTHWGGSAILQDYSPLGAQVYYSAGHESSTGEPNIQMSLVCDFSTLTWVARNVPIAANPNSSFVTGYAPDGTPYTPHTYLGLQEFPNAWGGGRQGTLASFFWAGAGWPNKVNLLDVSKTNNGFSRLTTNQPQNSKPTQISFSANGGAGGGSYPLTVIDYANQGWWAATSGTVDYTLFISRTGQITQYPALGGNLQDGAMVLCSSLNLLIGLDGGYESGDYASKSYRALYIRNLTTNTMTQNSTLGTVPGVGMGYDLTTTVPNYHRPNMLGLQWVDELGCIVGIDPNTTPMSIVKLTPPATSPETNPWTWSHVPVQHWDAGDPNGAKELQPFSNGAYSKFRWVPSLEAFVFGTQNNRKPQIIKL